MNEKDLQNKILELESYVKETKKNITRAEENIKQCEKAIQALKDLAWDKQSKKESSSMYKVLKEDKTHTRVKSNVGDIKVDKDFMDKEIKKHLDNPNLRGMVTTQEMLSFPKVAKGVEANNEARGYTWQVKANDGNTLVYESRKYETNNEKIHRLATSHSKTEKNERQAEVGGRSHPHHPIFNDFNFRKSAENIISQKTTKEAKTHFSQEQIKTMQEAVKKASQKLKENIKSIDIDLGKKNIGNKMDKKKIAFLTFAFVVAIIFSFFLSGILLLIFNKVHPLEFLKIWHFTIIFDGILNSYSHTYTAIIIALLISFGVLALLYFSSRQKESLFGEARFATENEIRKTGLLGNKNNYVKRGIIVGKYKDKFLKFGGQQFVALGAPTRSGKGVGIVIPNLLHWEESAVVQDIKQECFDYTSKYRAEKLDNEVFLFNPFSARTHRYNPFTYIDMSDEENADSQLMDLANIIYPLGTDDTSKFFSLQAQNLFIGLCYLYRDLALSEKGRLFVETYNLELEFNFFGILQLSKGFELIDPNDNVKLLTGFENTYNVLDSLDILGKATKRRIGTYIQIDSPNTKSGVMSSFNAPLSAFEGETLRLATQTSDFDLRELRKKKMTIYIGITPDQLANASFILNVFWSQLILLNTKELPQQNESLKYACLLLMDEFTAPGRIQILQTSVSFIAGYNLRLLTIYQSLSQLETAQPLGYGKEGAKTLLTNHACQIFYAPREQEDAEAISKILGNKTIKQSSKSINHGQMGGSRSISETHRALMLPQELREMPFENELITIDSGKPIKCNKAFYYSDTHFMDKFKEVSPSLKSVKGIPNRNELEKAILSGECNITIPIQKGENQ